MYELSSRYAEIHGFAGFFIIPLAVILLCFRLTRTVGAIFLGYYGGFIVGWIVSAIYLWIMLKVFFFIEFTAIWWLPKIIVKTIDPYISEYFTRVLINPFVFLPFWTFVCGVVGAIRAKRLTCRSSRRCQPPAASAA